MAAQFQTLSDDIFQLSNATGNNKKLPFNLPNLDKTKPVVLLFKVAMSGSNWLQMRMNNNPGLSIDFRLDPSPGLNQPRSWHEIIVPNGGLKESDNILSVTYAGGDHAAAATVSDIVFLYHG